jgi:hypothetical protein
MRTGQDLCSSANPDVIADDDAILLYGLKAYWDIRIVEAMLECDHHHMRGDPDVIANLDASVAEQNRVIIDGDIISYCDAATLSIDDHTAARKKPITDLDSAASEPKPRPVVHVWLLADPQRSA